MLANHDIGLELRTLRGVAGPATILTGGTSGKSVGQFLYWRLRRLFGSAGDSVIRIRCVDMDGEPGFPVPRPVLDAPELPGYCQVMLETPSRDFLRRGLEVDGRIRLPRIEVPQEMRRRRGAGQVGTIAYAGALLSGGTLEDELTAFLSRRRQGVREAEEAGLAVKNPEFAYNVGIFPTWGAHSALLQWWGEFWGKQRDELDRAAISTIVLSSARMGDQSPNFDMSLALEGSLLNLIHWANAGIFPELEFGRVLYLANPFEEQPIFLASAGTVAAALIVEPMASSLERLFDANATSREAAVSGAPRQSYVYLVGLTELADSPDRRLALLIAVIGERVSDQLLRELTEAEQSGEVQRTAQATRLIESESGLSLSGYLLRGRRSVGVNEEVVRYYVDQVSHEQGIDRLSKLVSSRQKGLSFIIPGSIEQIRENRVATQEDILSLLDSHQRDLLARSLSAAAVRDWSGGMQSALVSVEDERQRILQLVIEQRTTIQATLTDGEQFLVEATRARGWGPVGALRGWWWRSRHKAALDTWVAAYPSLLQQEADLLLKEAALEEAAPVIQEARERIQGQVERFSDVVDSLQLRRADFAELKGRAVQDNGSFDAPRGRAIPLNEATVVDEIDEGVDRLVDSLCRQAIDFGLMDSEISREEAFGLIRPICEARLRQDSLRTALETRMTPSQVEVAVEKCVSGSEPSVRPDDMTRAAGTYSEVRAAFGNRLEGSTVREYLDRLGGRSWVSVDSWDDQRMTFLQVSGPFHFGNLKTTRQFAAFRRQVEMGRGTLVARYPIQWFLPDPNEPLDPAVTLLLGMVTGVLEVDAQGITWSGRLIAASLGDAIVALRPMQIDVLRGIRGVLETRGGLERVAGNLAHVESLLEGDFMESRWAKLRERLVQLLVAYR